MTKEMIFSLAMMGAGALVSVLGWAMRKKSVSALKEDEKNKKARRGKTFGSVLITVGAWLLTINLLPLIFGKHESKPFTVEISPERFDIAGISISSTVLTTWAAMGVILILAVLARIFVIPRMKKVPKGIQNVLELAIGGIDEYTKSKAGDAGKNLSAYLFSLAVLLISCAAVELFGIRAPTADITMTFALALVTFFLINYYGIKHKGVGGRLKSLAAPTPIVFPFRVISDIAIPVSMACRLFGNMLGGMIVMELLYFALGSGAVGIPSVLGLYFNVFHPLIQAFVFITLSLTFINEAVETEQ